MAELDPEEQKKKAIFDAMSKRSRKRVLDRGYEQWDPFLPPKDPIDLRMSQRTGNGIVPDEKVFAGVSAGRKQ